MTAGSPEQIIKVKKTSFFPVAPSGCSRAVPVSIIPNPREIRCVQKNFRSLYAIVTVHSRFVPLRISMKMQNHDSL